MVLRLIAITNKLNMVDKNSATTHFILYIIFILLLFYSLLNYPVQLKDCLLFLILSKKKHQFLFIGYNYYFPPYLHFGVIIYNNSFLSNCCNYYDE